MCGRFVITSAPEALRRLFDYVEQPNFPPRYNIAPTQPVPVIGLDRGLRHFQLMRWGLIPTWVKDPRTFALLFNARGETVLDKPAFRNAIRRRRCLIPADGYYEWQTVVRAKQPYFIYRADRKPFAFAALWETWTGPNGEEMDTVAIVTAASTGAMKDLHPRVPVTLLDRDVASWLDTAQVDAEDAASMLRAPAEGEFVWHRVSPRVNRVANDDSELVAPSSEQEPQRDLPRLRGDRRRDDGQGNLF